MASLQSQASNGYLNGAGHGHAKITKSRSRPAVKPILKKLQAHSEKNSLDLDRSWEDQAQFNYASYTTGGRDTYATDGAYASPYASSTTHGNAPRSARDVSFSISASDLTSGAARPSKFSHVRSTSGTSHISVATSASGRNGSFVHPFQQTPRTSTPPLSYANSFVSLDNGTGPRDYSPTITEDDDDTDAQTFGSRATFGLPHSQHSRPRRPSLASQRTSSLSDVNQPVRMTSSSRTNSGIRSTQQRIVTKSRSDLHLNTASSPALDSASSASPPTTSFVSPQAIAASSSLTGVSPLRSSLEMNGFRLRSRSEVTSSMQTAQVREARRKFEEKEKAKEEKYNREKIRKQERADQKEANRQHKPLIHGRKSFGHSRVSCEQTASNTDIRPSFSRKNTGTGLDEKLDFASQGYETARPGQVPNARADGVHFESARRTTAKRKTTGTWTAFVLWLRTRLLKLGRR